MYWRMADVLMKPDVQKQSDVCLLKWKVKANIYVIFKANIYICLYVDGDWGTTNIQS